MILIFTIFLNICFEINVTATEKNKIHELLSTENVEMLSIDSNLENLEIVKIGEAEKHLKYYREDRGYSTYVVCSIVGFYENDIFHPAYCMNKELPGAEDGNYNVSVEESLNNVKVWKIISNGYPYKSYEEMGLENEWDAFAVTKFAIYCILGESKIEYYSVDENDVRGQRMLTVLKELVEYSNDENVNIEKGNVQLEKVGEIKEGISYYYQEYRVVSNIDMKEYKLYNLSGFPEGTYVANTKNIYQGEFKTGENFRILIPKEKFKNEIKGEISIGSELKNYPVFYGKAPAGRQDYILTYDKYGEKVEDFELNLNINTGKIKIIKIDGESKEFLQGVSFELINIETEDVFQKVTDENGEIIFDCLYPGKYILKEIIGLDGYDLNEEEIEIDVPYNSEIEIVIENKKQLEPPQEGIEEPEIPEEIIPEEIEKIEEIKEELLEENKNIPEIEVKLPKTGM